MLLSFLAGLFIVRNVESKEKYILTVLSQIYQDFPEKWKILSCLLMLGNFLKINFKKEDFLRCIIFLLSLYSWTLGSCDLSQP